MCEKKKIILECEVIAKPTDIAKGKIQEDLQKPDPDKHAIAKIINDDDKNESVKKINGRSDTDNNENCK